MHIKVTQINNPSLNAIAYMYYLLTGSCYQLKEGNSALN